MDQILVGLSVCCPPQSEHLDIRKVANSHAHVGVILKRRLKCPKLMFFFFCFFLYFLHHTFIVQAVS